MKRVTYISRFAKQLSGEEINEIGRVSQKNNSRDEITGVLISTADIFYQEIEGEEESIDTLFEKIKRDTRHKDVLCLKTEKNIEQRRYPKWSMKTVNIDAESNILMHPIRNLFQVLADSYGVIEKYTQPTVLKFVTNGINPLNIPSRETKKIILFCDIMAFSYFSSILNVQEVVSMTNTYLTACTQVLDRSGGEVTKYMGDCVMAYFDIEQADEAIRAGLDMLSGLERMREEVPKDSPLRFLHTGIGISSGSVIEGNIGSATKLDYTILGDAVNQAASLESLTRCLPRALAISQGVRDLSHGEWPFIQLGEYELKGGHDPVPVYSVDLLITEKPTNPLEIIDEISRTLEGTRLPG